MLKLQDILQITQLKKVKTKWLHSHQKKKKKGRLYGTHEFVSVTMVHVTPLCVEVQK